MLKMMVQGGQLELGEISRIVVDLFLAAADTVSLIAGGIFIFNWCNRLIADFACKPMGIVFIVSK